MTLFKNQIKLTLILLFAGIGIQNGQAQHKDRYEKIRTLKIAYISDQMNFSEEEAERFWPIYNRYDRLKNENRQKTSKFIKSISPDRDFESISESDAKKLLVYMKSSRLTDFEYDQKMTEEISDLIGYKKTVQLYHIERDFNRKLFKKVKVARGDGPPPSPKEQKPAPL
ncbi:MAG: hypothetical protein ACPGRE_04215 [Flavobacteriaceae bacterium]